MKIVIDTNVVISGTFFGGAPRRVIESVGKNGINACATTEIIEEYEEIVEEMIARKQGHIRRSEQGILFRQGTSLGTRKKMKCQKRTDIM